jgi:DNA-binding response OmpR family regulator
MKSISKTSTSIPQILLYCNESGICQELAVTLAQTYNIILTPDFNKLESLVLDGHYNIVLSEIPANGHDLLSMLTRIFQRKPQTHIVLLDGSPEQATVAAAFRLGVSDYFPQPINFSLLLERVDALIKVDINKSMVVC